MSRLALLALVVVLGCGKRERQHRTGDAALVERITAPVLVDGAAPKGTADELEPNDTDDTAMELAVGHSSHGRVDPLDTDVDCYRVEIAAAGVLALELTSVKDVDLSLELHDAGGTLIARSDRPGETKEGFPNFGVAKGRYTACVRGRKLVRNGKPVKPPTPALPYDLSAQLVTPPANAEHEPDDDRGTANDLIAGDPVSGYIGWSGDADVWKLSLDTLSGNNVLDIELAPLENTSLVLELADAMGQPLLTRKGPRGQGLSIRGLKPNLPAGAPPYEYLTIKASPSNPESPYSLKATAKNPETSDAELEPNDSIDKPMPIPADRTVVNAQWSPGDIDCFAVAPEGNPRGLEIKIEAPPTADLGVELLVDGKVIAKADTKGKGVAETVKGPVPANAKAVIRVHGADGGTEGNYEVKVIEGPFK